jgi:hypothetical protein
MLDFAWGDAIRSSHVLHDQPNLIAYGHIMTVLNAWPIMIAQV